MAPSRRRSPRAPFTGTVAVCRGSGTILVAAADIGTTGVRVHTDERPALRSLLTLHVALPGQRRGFTVVGRVVRLAADAREMAVEFLDILPSQKDALLRYITATAPQELARAG